MRDERQQSIARRLCAAGLRGCAVATSLGTGALAALYVAVSTGGLSLDPVLPVIQERLSARSGNSLSIGSAAILKSETGGPMTLIVKDVVGRGNAGRISLPGVAMEIATADVLRGKVFPRYLKTEGAVLTVVRTRGGFRLGEGAAEESGGAGGYDLSALIAKIGEEGFEGTTIAGATLRYRNEVTGGLFEVEDATLTVFAADGGYEAKALVPLGAGQIAFEGRIGDGVRAEFSLSNVSAQTLRPLLPESEALPLGDAAVSGRIIVKAGLPGGDAPIAVFSLRTRGGDLGMARGSVPLGMSRARGVFDFASRTVSIEDSLVLLGESRIAATGRLTLGPTPTFSLQGEELSLALPPYEGLLSLSRAAVTGRYLPQEGRLVLDDLRAEPPGGGTVGGHLAVDFPEKGGGAPGLSGHIASEGALSMADVMMLWPDRVAPLAKDWVRGHVDGGEATAFSLDLAIPPGAVGNGMPLPRDALDLTFAARGAQVTYVDGMPPAIGARASGRVTARHFEVEARGGHTGGARIERASFTVPDFTAPIGTGITSARLSGETRKLLSLADAPPFGFIGKAGLDPADFSGEGVFSMRLERPLAPVAAADEISFAGEGRFDALSLDGLPAGIELTGAGGDLEISGQGLVIEADLLAQGIPARGEIRTDFGPGGGTVITASATLSPRDADTLGLPVRRFAQGTAPATLVISGKERLETAVLTLDLTPTRLSVAALGIDKDAGLPGKFDIAFRLAEDRPPHVETLRLSTDDALIEGNAFPAADGGIERIELPRVFIEGHADLSVVLTRKADRLKLGVEGRFLDARPLVSALLSGGEGGAAGLPIEVEAGIDDVLLRGGLHLRDAKARVGYDGTVLSSLSVDGKYAGGGELFLGVVPDGLASGRRVSLFTDRFGLLLRGLFGITSVTAGEASVTARALQDGVVAGEFAAKELNIKDAPLIAKLLSVGSLTGLEALLAGEGILFDELRGEASLDAGVLSLHDTRLVGSALGLSVQGDVDLDARRFDLSGAVAPAYSVNSLLGRLPGLGRLFVSREGEGVLAFAYGVEGPMAAPSVSVNTLSALTPGIIRRLFEPVRGTRKTPAEILAEAEAAAREEDVSAAGSAEALADAEARREGAAEAGLN